MIGVLLGVTSAVKRGSLFDGISMVIATIGVCVPLFVISVLLLYLFAGVLKWLPTYGLTTWKHYILPVTCLSFSPIAYIARMTRSSMLEVMQQDLSLIHISMRCKACSAAYINMMRTARSCPRCA